MRVTACSEISSSTREVHLDSTCWVFTHLALKIKESILFAVSHVLKWHKSQPTQVNSMEIQFQYITNSKYNFFKNLVIKKDEHEVFHYKLLLAVEIKWWSSKAWISSINNSSWPLLVCVCLYLQGHVVAHMTHFDEILVDCAHILFHLHNAADTKSVFTVFLK